MIDLDTYDEDPRPARKGFRPKPGLARHSPIPRPPIAHRWCPTLKTCYLSEAEAMMQAVRVQLHLGKTQRPYDCPHCPFWHLTTQPPRHG